jgi:uncharacterized protein YbaP (TraB family)
MKYTGTFLFGFLTGYLLYAQPGKSQIAVNQGQTFLWEITGKNLQKPSYLFGTIHVICGKDAVLGKELKKVIRNVDRIFFEADLAAQPEGDSLLAMFKMKDQITLASILSPVEYEKIKNYFSNLLGSRFFAEIENYKPMLLASMVQFNAPDCAPVTSLEQVIQQEASFVGTPVEGLESLAFQASVFDSIPYRDQAKQLLEIVNNTYDANSEMQKLMSAYRAQDLRKIQKITYDESWSLHRFIDLVVYKRNREWLKRVTKIFPSQSILLAVGVGHLPGPEGLINLLRKAGYTVRPLRYTISQK